MIKNISISPNVIKVIAILCFLLVDIGLIYAHNTPATGYESSIYTSTPMILWISIFIAMVCGVSIIVYSVYNSLKNKMAWILGLFLVLFFYVITNSIYLIRGYYMWVANGDISSHILFVKEIMDSGHTPTSLIYPITHIYMTTLVDYTNIGIIPLEKLVPIYFVLMFVLFVYVLAKSVFSIQGQAILATLASLMFLPGITSFYPNFLANCLFPFFLYILIKILGEKKLSWITLSLVLIFLYPLFHIVPTFVVAVMLATLLISAWVYNLFNIKSKAGHYIYGLLLFVLIVWSTIWITSFQIWNFTIENTYQLVTWGSGTSYASTLNSQVNQAQNSGYNVMDYILKQEGKYIVFILIAAVICPVAWKVLRSKKIDVLLLFYASLLTLGISTVAMYFVNIGFSPLRLLFYIITICALFVGLAIFTCIDKIRAYRSGLLRHALLGVLIIGIIILFTDVLLVLYPSPFNLQQNYQTTKEEVYGMSMLLDHRDINLVIVNTNLAYWRFAHLLLSPEELSAQNIPESVPFSYSTATPYHFGYNNNTMFGSTYKADAYLLVTQRDRTVYTDIFPSMAPYRFTADDFNKLPGDTSLSKIYSNGEFDTYNLYH